MAKPGKISVHFSTLITKARLQLGFSTLRELYRAKSPTIDYQTWLHAESGRRIPSTSIVMNMAEILELDKQALLIAYCKDKFDAPDYHEVLNLFEHNRFANIDALLEARDHERSGEFIFTQEQVKAFQGDIRLWLFLLYTYDRELKTDINRLARFFNLDNSSVKKIVHQLQSLHLVEVIGDIVKRNYAHTNLPKNIDSFNLRKELLLSSLALGLMSDSHVVNYYVNITEASHKKILNFFDFIEANLTKLDIDDKEKMNSHRFQITLTSNRILEGSEDGKK